MVAPDCFGCRASVPRYCASCVQQAITERRQRLKEIEGDKYRLERGMRPSLAQRRSLLEQREARRVHAARTARLSAELTSVRAESDRQAISVNEIRHAIRRHQLQLQQPPKLTRTPRVGPPCGTYGRHVPASCVLHVPEAQGSLPPGPHALYAPCTMYHVPWRQQARAAAAALTLTLTLTLALTLTLTPNPNPTLTGKSCRRRHRPPRRASCERRSSAHSNPYPYPNPSP